MRRPISTLIRREARSSTPTSGAITWSGRDRRGLRVFVASHAHLVPREVWQDYLRVITLQERLGADSRPLSNAELAVLDPVQHGDLVDLRDSKDWSLAYEDDHSAIFVRRYGRGPIGG